ncbi:hypothetical protein IQ06DRAFT_302181 [Phaeosphaeriaceae sp. SRC1lsM3a]|nr:hypothetical protein IQ06DRAFT_302181 [Stagonospora sp. SRC1lsM3a]
MCFSCGLSYLHHARAARAAGRTGTGEIFKGPTQSVVQQERVACRERANLTSTGHAAQRALATVCLHIRSLEPASHGSHLVSTALFAPPRVHRHGSLAADVGSSVLDRRRHAGTWHNRHSIVPAAAVRVVSAQARVITTSVPAANFRCITSHIACQKSARVLRGGAGGFYPACNAARSSRARWCGAATEATKRAPGTIRRASVAHCAPSIE